MATTQRLQALQNTQFGSKSKIAKNMRKTALEAQCNCSMQKRARKNSWFSKNETILKIGKDGHHAKPIAFAKYLV